MRNENNFPSTMSQPNRKMNLPAIKVNSKDQSPIRSRNGRPPSVKKNVHQRDSPSVNQGRTIPNMYSYENKMTRKRLKQVQSRYKQETPPKQATTLEKVILHQVRNTVGTSYPKSYIHLCGFIEMGIVSPDYVYNNHGSNLRSRSRSPEWRSFT